MLLVSGSTRTVRGLADRHPAALGHLLTPGNRNVASVFGTGLKWAADNGCYRGLDAPAFRRLLAKVTGRPGCLFVVCPDVVADARATLARFAEWRAEVAAAGQPVAFVGQDGQEGLPVPWAEFDCLFVGGSTAWKLGAAAWDLAREAKRRGKWVHLGRVNSRRRLRHAWAMRADSTDGSSASMFGDTYIPKYLRWQAEMLSWPG